MTKISFHTYMSFDYVILLVSIYILKVRVYLKKGILRHSGCLTAYVNNTFYILVHIQERNVTEFVVMFLIMRRTKAKC